MKRFPVVIQRKLLSAMVCGLLSGGLLTVSAFAIAQDQQSQDPSATEQEQQAEQQNDQATGATTPEDDKRRNNGLNSTPEKRTLYFIGPKVSSQRQQGPSIGAPVSILPKPLVAKGSVEIPTPIEAAAAGDLGQYQTNEVDPSPAGPGAEVGNQDIGQGQVQDQGLGQNQDAVQPIDTTPVGDAVDGTLPLGADIDGTDQSAIQEGALEQIDPSGLPVLGLVNSLDTVWQGYDRDTIQAFLQELSRPSFSPTLTRLASSIAGSRFSLPAPANQDEILKIIEARLAVFEATANARAYTSLLDGLPVDGDWSALASHTAKAHLLKGELIDACLIADTERAYDTDPYWVRLAAFCMAATGNRAGVDFQLGILEETTELEPVFYQLLDQILIEAERPAGAVLSGPITLNGPLQTDILTVAMARLSRAQIPAIDAKGLNPLAIPLLLENPSLSLDAQSMLVTYLLERGFGDGLTIAAFANSFVLQEGEAEAALAFADIASEAKPLDDETEEAQQAPKPDEPATEVMPEGKLQTILLALIAGAGTEEQKHLAFNHFWQHSLNTNKLAAAAPALSALTRGEGFATASQISPNAMGSLARVALLSGDNKAASGWSRHLRTSVAGQDAEVDRALVSIWPLLAVQEEAMPLDFTNRLGLWWQLQTENPLGFKQANLLFGIMDANNADVPDALWDTLARGPAVFDGVMMSPALWRKFERDVQAEDPVAALLSLYQLLSQVGPADLPPAISAVLVAGLRSLGFEDTARALALEILISQKL